MGLLGVFQARPWRCGCARLIMARAWSWPMTRFPGGFRGGARSRLRPSASCRWECRSRRRPRRPRCGRPRRRASGAFRPWSASSSALRAASSARRAAWIDGRRRGRRGGFGGRRGWRHGDSGRGCAAAAAAGCARQPRAGPAAAAGAAVPSSLARISRMRPTRSRSFSQRACSSASRASAAVFCVGQGGQALGVIRAEGGFALQNADLHGAIVDLAHDASSMAGGVAFWPSDSRAQAVSSTLTALSGSWRSGR